MLFEVNFFKDTNGIDFVCYVILILCFVLYFYISQRKNYNHYMSKSTIILFRIGVIGFLFLVLISFNDKINYNEKYCEFKIITSTTNKMNSDSNLIKDISFNKTIIIGDSRMWLIEKARDQLNIPINFSFIAESGTKIDWLKREALPKLVNKLDTVNDGYTYHVVINMGVNDLNDNISAVKRANEYFELYNELSSKYYNVKFYLLSVNPIDESIINKIWIGNNRNNRKINAFNNEMNRLVLNSKNNNIYSCDSYHSISFKTLDGLHYELETNQNILDYIVNKCVQYE